MRRRLMDPAQLLKMQETQKLRLLNERLMQINTNLHLTHGVSHIQVINLALNMQTTQIN